MRPPNSNSGLPLTWYLHTYPPIPPFSACPPHFLTIFWGWCLKGLTTSKSSYLSIFSQFTVCKNFIQESFLLCSFPIQVKAIILFFIQRPPVHTYPGRCCGINLTLFRCGKLFVFIVMTLFVSSGCYFCFCFPFFYTHFKKNPLTLAH